KNGWEAFKFFPRRLSDEKPSHHVLATSEFIRPIFGSAFQTKNVSTAGYPRIDGFAFDCIKNLYTQIEQSTLKRIRKLLDEDAENKMLYYMPTFRNSETEFFNRIDLERFQQFLRKNHLIFCVKLHPKSKLRERFSDMEKGNIINIDADTDPYVFLPLSHALVTDYSSIYFDYLFTGKPIIFFAYDLDAYLNDSRDMYFDYEEYTPGIKVNNQKDLERALLDVKNGLDGYKEKRDALWKRMYDRTDAPVSELLVKEILAAK
ncbi:MAG: CDP-glycerol glycerophosphotransferase family protein, partial [Bacteroidales bacterium]|nr:CDP-glycerol glycerophosphotransferase family protein [Bacteroidales bacterium]